MTIPTITLNNGVAMPQLGFGVFQVPNDETEAAVTAALEAGYRSIDTAAVYGNEAGVGHALAKSGIAREELFITTKLWSSDHERPVEAYEKSLELLGLDHVDLYLIHWPTPARDLYLGAWQGLEELYAAGRVRAIGVSNFLPEHLDRIVALGGTVPAVNQIELHPALQQRATVAANDGLGIATEAWSPLAQGAMLQEPVITTVADRLGRTPAQVILRWHLQQGRIVIPKSVTPARIAQNLDVLGFDLADADLAAIDALESEGRTGPDPATFNAA
ncbi:aldo/keto reductase [Nocardioides albus]|uniref:2,5-diketo-D-gluconate reductase A n=1 Tax=Nocardioides albus TaxID=1841 RepID=A0A7W5A9F0_9ACTN|nr:aldo/keto reductase [Nocardioides albus]MBB3092132.1 2,5-diketo-D-gluconate reductase A [Nocardioides albus]GGU45867.1 oxidoreductase [Nocardioides albus]